MSPFLLKFIPNLDLLSGYMTALLVGLYIPLYGYLTMGGFSFGEFTPVYLIVLLPIWLVDGVKVSFESLIARQYKTAKEDITKVTVIIACKDGEEVIGDTLRSLKRKFPADQIIVASNGSTDKTCEIARSYGVVCLDFTQPLGKVRAINAALPHAKTPYVLLLDDDTLVAGATIPTGLLDDGYDAVAFRVLVKLDTWVSYLQLQEYRKSCDIGRRYHNKGGSVQCISGAIGLFRRETLVDQIGKHTGEFSGEDLQRTLLIHLATHFTSRKRGVVLARSTVITKAPTTIGQLFKQRVFGWFPGLYANFPNFARILGYKRAPLALRLDALYNCLLVTPLDIFRILTLPVLIFRPWFFVVTYIAYVALECIPYVRSGRIEPVWVLLVYPFYGIFSLLTRICAGPVFFYRRLAVKMSRLQLLDDYRRSPAKVKWTSAMLISLVVASLLALNITINYASRITT